MAKKTRFGFRTTEEFKKRIADVAKTLNLDQAVIAEAALEAVVAYVEKHGEITIPVRLSEPNPEKKEPVRSPSQPASAAAARSLSSPTALHGPNEPESHYLPRKRKS